MRVFRGIDIGGTAIKVVDVDVDSMTVLEAMHVPSTPLRDENFGIGLLVELCNSRDARLVGIGVAAPGTVDESSGIVLDAPNLGWRGVPLVSALARRGISVVLAHDVRAAARAELLTPDAPDTGHTAVFVAVGTGIAAAVASGATLLSGSASGAGEIGHLRVSGERTPCTCGRTGCLETVASALAIGRRFRERGGQRADAAFVVERARAGEESAQEVWGEAILALAEGLATVTLLLDPDRLVIGGGLVGAGDALLVPLMEALSSAMHPWPSPRLERAQWGRFAGGVGAALVAAEAAR